MKILDQIRFEESSVLLRSDGIMEVTINEDIDIDVPLVKKLVAAVGKLGKGQQFPILTVIHAWSMPNEKTRAFVAKKESNPYSLADAFVVNSLPQKIVGNFYMQINAPKRSTKLFSVKEDAIHWLKQFQTKQ